RKKTRSCVCWTSRPAMAYTELLSPSRTRKPKSLRLIGLRCWKLRKRMRKRPACPNVIKPNRAARLTLITGLAMIGAADEFSAPLRRADVRKFDAEGLSGFSRWRSRGGFGICAERRSRFAAPSGCFRDADVGQHAKWRCLYLCGN